MCALIFHLHVHVYEEKEIVNCNLFSGVEFQSEILS